MDKTKEYLALLQKHHFWVVCGVVLIASLVSWYLAESSLDQQREAQKQKIEAAIASVTSVVNKADHPNDVMTGKQRDASIKVADNVYETWKLRYEEQQKVPQWQGNLQKSFLEFINKAGPDDHIPIALREDYRDYIGSEIEKLFEQIDVRELKDIPNPVAPPPAGRPNTGRPAENIGVFQEWKGMVAWDETLRQELRNQYDWSDRRPTTLQVRYANEDLWIYRALLEILKTTNSGAKEHLVAPIKKIDGLYIGQKVPLPNTFFIVAEGAAGSEGAPPGEGEGGMSAPPTLGGTGGGEGGEGAPAAATIEQVIDANLKHYRYVDDKGKPLAYNAPEAYEFKIMPFYMNLVMDQRKVPDLLANCANSPLPVEVRQVDINSTEAPPTVAGGGGGEGRGPGRPGPTMPGLGGMRPGGGRGLGGEGGIGPPMGGGRPPRPPANRGEGGTGGGGDLGGAVELRPVDLHVELRGVIYIFNKPDRSKVGKVAPPQDPLPEAAAPAAEQPAAPPPSAG